MERRKLVLSAMSILETPEITEEMLKESAMDLMDKKEITVKYNSLSIKERGEINITAYEICELLNKEPGSFIGVIYNDLEYKILNNLLINEKNEIKRYINDNY